MNFRLECSICIENVGFCVENVGFCIENVGFCIKDVGFCRMRRSSVTWRSSGA